MRAPTPQKDTEAWWRDQLSGKAPRFTEDAQAGWYWDKKHRQGRRIGVRIWLHSPVDEEGNLSGDEVMYGQIYGHNVTGDDLLELWNRVCRHAISDADYNKYLRPGYDPEKDDDNFLP